jgi:membrane-bound lytic murein transglycosylase A
LQNYLFILLISLLFIGCSTKEELKKEEIPTPKEIVKKENTAFDYLNGFYKDDLDLALDVFKKACTQSRKKEQFRDVCDHSHKFTNGKEFFTKNFTPKILVSNTGDKGLITGYYEPLLHGSRIKTDVYKYPVYKTPKNLVTIKNKKRYPHFKRLRYKAKIRKGRYIPYDTRAQIEENNNFEAICYVDDLIDLFFLQVQGSGRVLLDSGELINIGYSNQNGRKYKSIGKKLIDDGHLVKEEVSLQTIRAFLDQNPQKVKEILNHNPSYVFFIEKKETATGSLNVPLVPKRNIAVDRKYIPLGMPVFLETTNPKTNEAINKLVIAADTGGAIKGEIRADYFLGYGDEAREIAGLMKEEGRLFMLIPNDVVID